MDAVPVTAEDLLREELREAESMSPEERMLAGPRLFDLACKMSLAGLRAEHPHATELQLVELLRARLDQIERWDQRR
jgi:hypothetical protein